MDMVVAAAAVHVSYVFDGLDFGLAHTDGLSDAHHKVLPDAVVRHFAIVMIELVSVSENSSVVYLFVSFRVHCM